MKDVKTSHSILLINNFTVTEPNYAQLLELLHVPLQSIYHRAPPSENGDKVL